MKLAPVNLQVPSLENKQRGMIELIMSTFVLIYHGVTLDLKDFAVHPSPFPQGTWYMIRANLSESLVNTRKKLSKLDYLWWMVFPTSNYMFKVNNRNSTTRCEKCSLNIFQTFFYCFCCWLWARKCQLPYFHRPCATECICAKMMTTTAQQ